ncbi:glycosyltransferase [uncultured Algibacter sp.]|uniref:glycosyltransferase n=1 Tax=uncultured Algibacter sp. TaxID=298659 RepID=UPI00261F9BC0|nr:glycosyltransferase [uncultured Algibacter sp.]
MTPFFSVVIPLYNKEAFIEKTIKSVLNQDLQDFELIIVDDGSTDNSFKIVSNYKNSKIRILKQLNQGVSVARNNGIENSKGNYIALLDADDLWSKNHLFELKRQILFFPNAGLYCNNYEIFYSKSLTRPANLNFRFNKECLIVKDFFMASITQSVAWTSAVAFEKEKFKSVGSFNTSLKTAQDLDLWIKMALKYPVSFNPCITMSYKLYVEESLSKNEYNDIRYEFINSYKEDEKNNSSLKVYLDVNRYALAIRCLLNDENQIYNKVKKEINYGNLNFKQKLLINSPKFLLLIAKGLHNILKKTGFYLSAYK